MSDLAWTYALLLKNDRRGLENFKIEHVQDVIYALTKFEIKEIEVYNYLIPYTKKHIDTIKSAELSLLIWSVCHLIKWDVKWTKQDINLESILNVYVKWASVIVPLMKYQDANII